MTLELTAQGIAFFQEALHNEHGICFRYLSIGDGEKATDSSGSATDLSHTRLSEIPLVDWNLDQDGYVHIKATYNNVDVTSGFAATELGVFVSAEPPDTTAVPPTDPPTMLFAYGYAEPEKADYVPAGGQAGESAVETKMEIVIYVGSVRDVTVNVVSLTYVTQTEFNAHLQDTSNPHSVTKTQVGLGNVPNVTTNNQTPTYTEAASLDELASGEVLSTAFGKIAKAIKSLISHIADTSNPHSVTASQIGLGNVENKSAATILSELVVDASPTSGSSNPVQSGGVFRALAGYVSKSDTAEQDVVSNLGIQNTGPRVILKGTDPRNSGDIGVVALNVDGNVHISGQKASANAELGQLIFNSAAQNFDEMVQVHDQSQGGSGGYYNVITEHTKNTSFSRMAFGVRNGTGGHGTPTQDAPSVISADFDIKVMFMWQRKGEYRIAAPFFPSDSVQYYTVYQPDGQIAGSGMYYYGASHRVVEWQSYVSEEVQFNEVLTNDEYMYLLLG